MSAKHIEERWFHYGVLIKIMHASLNGEVVLNPPGIHFPPFPKKISKWHEWADRILVHMSIQETIVITDQTLKKVSGAMSTTHIIAAAVIVEAPNSVTISSLIEGLESLNKVVKQDGRFHAALAIGTAVAKEVDRRRKMA